MTPEELKKIREELGLSLAAFGRALGYKGNDNNIRTDMHRMESGSKNITEFVGRLAIMFEKHGVPAEFNDPEYSERHSTE